MNKVRILNGEERECTPIRATGNTTSNKPKHHCNNCKCDRYNPCGCIRKNK